MERDALNGNYGGYPNISTHTLTWSVTFGAEEAIYRRINFNSHAHVERDLFSHGVIFYIIYFNSHAHVERDLQG